jgi:hypothetical protein
LAAESFTQLEMGMRLGTEIARRWPMNEPYQREHQGRESVGNGHSLAELSRQPSVQATRTKVDLGKGEMAIKANRLGTAIGAFGAAVLISLLALGALTV